MRIGVLSDTHHNAHALRHAMATAGAVDMWFHLGDNVSDAVYLRELSGKKVHLVRGNCDLRASDLFEAQEMTVEAEGKRFLLCHGHLLRVKSGLSTLHARAEKLGVDCALFGHTHRAEMEQIGGILLLNPGSPAEPRGGFASVAVLSIEDGEIHPEIREVVVP